MWLDWSLKGTSWEHGFPESIAGCVGVTTGSSSLDAAPRSLILNYTHGTTAIVHGNELRAIRRTKLKLTQAQLGERLGVTVTSVARWERNERTMSAIADRFVRVLAALRTAGPFALVARVEQLLAPPKRIQPKSPSRRRKTQQRG